MEDDKEADKKKKPYIAPKVEEWQSLDKMMSGAGGL